MWFDNLINVHSAVQGIVILSLICTLGLLTLTKCVPIK